MHQITTNANNPRTLKKQTNKKTTKFGSMICNVRKTGAFLLPLHFIMFYQTFYYDSY
jgi:hypothetical protein